MRRIRDAEKMCERVAVDAEVELRECGTVNPHDVEADRFNNDVIIILSSMVDFIDRKA